MAENEMLRTGYQVPVDSAQIKRQEEGRKLLEKLKDEATKRELPEELKKKPSSNKSNMTLDELLKSIKEQERKGKLGLSPSMITVDTAVPKDLMDKLINKND